LNVLVQLLVFLSDLAVLLFYRIVFMQMCILLYYWAAKQKESVIKAELKRCISIERRWNRNEVSRGSPDKEVNRRPTSLKKSRADALRRPRVSIATG